jgi:hypothetical protein
MTLSEPGHSHPAEALPVSRLYLIAEGEAITDIGVGITTLGHLDGCICRQARQRCSATTARTHCGCCGSTPLRSADAAVVGLRHQEIRGSIKLRGKSGTQWRGMLCSQQCAAGLAGRSPGGRSCVRLPAAVRSLPPLPFCGAQQRPRRCGLGPSRISLGQHRPIAA